MTVTDSKENGLEAMQSKGIVSVNSPTIEHKTWKLYARASKNIEKDRDIARESLQQLSEILEKDPDNVELKEMYLPALANFYKKAKRLREKIKAIDVYEQIIADETLHILIKAQARQNLVEYLLGEYMLYEEQSVIDEIISQIQIIEEIAVDNSYYPMMFQAIILKSKVETVLGNFDRAEAYLQQAQDLTYHKGLQHLQEITEEIKTERQEFEAKLENLKQSIETSNVYSRIEQTRIFDYIKQARERSQKN